MSDVHAGLVGLYETALETQLCGDKDDFNEQSFSITALHQQLVVCQCNT
jgi:hypothetical protein